MAERQLGCFETGARVTKPSAIVIDFAYQRAGTVCREGSHVGVMWDGSPRIFEYPADCLFLGEGDRPEQPETGSQKLHLVQHVPTFVDGATPKIAEADTIEDLLSVPWVADYGKDNPFIDKHGNRGVRVFYRFSVDSIGSTHALMVEHDEGRYWWVAGNITGYTGGLPKWEPKE